MQDMYFNCSLQVLIDQYGEEVDEDLLRQEYPGVMALLGRQDWCLQESLQKLATDYQVAYPETAKLAQLGLLIPMSTAGNCLIS